MASLYIGPFTEDSCKRAEHYIPAMCKQAEYLYACNVDGKPWVYTTCPHFTYPEIKIK
jgi:hypothetical protein